MKTQNIQLVKYLLADIISAVTASVVCRFDGCVWGVLTIFWLAVYWLSGYYNGVVRRSRLTEFVTTFVSVLVGMFCIGALVFAEWLSLRSYHQFLCYFAMQFLLTYFLRFFITQHFRLSLKKGLHSFRTLVIGIGEKANHLPKNIGTEIVGYVRFAEKEEPQIAESEVLGKIENLNEIVRDNKIDEIVIATENADNKLIFSILNQMYSQGVEVKLIESLRNLPQVNMPMDSILGNPYVNLSHNKMPYWQQNTKRVFDMLMSVVVLVLASPLMLYIALRIKATSPGPVFYKQERIGRYGQKFNIIKFRSMKMDAETDGPQLSSEEDDRITSVGRTLRRFRLDELPQFFNVLRGDMSIVGYRPERAYFVDKISEKSPEYYLLLRILPGITSWGMVKYGYATSVDKMIERLHYDIIYAENCTLLIDLKILIHTFIIILRGREIINS